MPSAGLLVAAAGAYLAVAWTLVVLVDVFDVAGVGSRFAESEIETPHVWFHLFREGSPTEWLQWSLLGATAVLAGGLTGWYRARSRRGPDRFWLLFAVTAVILLIEDAGNPRHRITNYAEPLVGTSLTSQNLVELGYYALLASVPLYAIVRHGRHVWAVVGARRYLVAAVALYAVASVASASRNLGGWYGRFGDAVVADGLFGGRLAPYEDLGLGLGYWLTDFLVEESVELLGAACLCAVVLAAVARERAAPTPSPPPADRHERRPRSGPRAPGG